jgi:aromatic ring hydroxylase
MALPVTAEATGARTGEQFLEGLRQGGREIWLRGERISHPLDHPELRDAALSLARVFELQHEHAASMLAPSPSGDLVAPARLVNVTHLIPRASEDLLRRRRAFELVAALSGGMMGRTPDYLNVTFACFAGRSEVWARRGNERGAANLVAYQEYMRDADLSTTHALMNPQVDRNKPEAEQAMGQVALHKVGETTDSIVVRGARMLATLAPFADELLVYPGSDIRPQDGRYALSFAIPIATQGLRFICRDSYSKQRDAYDYPLSSRFDEMDAVVIFDDVEIPRERMFLDGDTTGYSEVITDTGWRSHIMHQAFTRAWVKLSFDRGRGGWRRSRSRWGDDSRRAAVRGLARRDAEVAAAGQRAASADRGRRFHGDAVSGRSRGAAPRRDRAVLPGRGRRRRAADPALPAGLGLPRVRARRPRGTV